MRAGSTTENQETRIGRDPKCPMSAYRASAPVTVSTTAPIAANAGHGSWIRKMTAQCGDSAVRISGRRRIHGTPRTARQVNQSAMIGPKARPMKEVPRRCTRNRAPRMTIEAGSTTSASAGSTTATPSMALITEIAGVITESP